MQPGDADVVHYASGVSLGTWPVHNNNSNDSDLPFCRDRPPQAQPQMQPLSAQQQQVALPFAERSFSHLDLTSQV
jgi:hypothetical protein